MAANKTTQDNQKIIIADETRRDQGEVHKSGEMEMQNRHTSMQDRKWEDSEEVPGLVKRKKTER
jgi:hypothetical protein